MKNRPLLCGVQRGRPARVPWAGLLLKKAPSCAGEGRRDGALFVFPFEKAACLFLKKGQAAFDLLLTKISRDKESLVPAWSG